MQPEEQIILTGQCRDQKGLVAAITTWIFQHQGNILHLDQHVDASSERFFIRVHWQLDGFAIAKNQISERFANDIAKNLGLDFNLSFSSDRPRMAIFVSTASHCLWDLLARCESGELRVEVPLIISNHQTLRPVADRFSIPFYYLPITPANKLEQEAAATELLKQNNIDLVVLARYMQVLSAAMVAHYSNRIINIHHSFLPAFPGAKPYHRAHERGVKLIGATAHYVTAELDEGPIIEQDTVRVHHGDSVEDLMRLGRDLEKIVLSRAVFMHVNRQIIVHGQRTVVFA